MQITTLPELSLPLFLLATCTTAQNWQSIANSAESLAATIAAPYTSFANSIVSSAQSVASDAVLSATRDASSVVESAQSVVATAGDQERSSALSLESQAVVSANSVAKSAGEGASRTSTEAAQAMVSGTNDAVKRGGGDMMGMVIVIGAVAEAIL
ncbi:hypothetical protein IFR05_006679 [Cadophora sp. M221]|nr:hypothetical protein IFR05_006679 [Cadophora sp. M221]